MNRRAFSLFELMVSMALGSLALLVIQAVLVPLTRQAWWGYNQIDLGRTALQLASHWRRDLGQTALEGCALDGSRAWLLRPLAPHPAGPTRAWLPALVCYRWDPDSGRLTRLETPASGSPLLGAAQLPAPEQWNGLAALAPARLLAEGVTDFSCQTRGPLVELSAVLLRSVAGRGPLRYEWRETVLVRN